MELWSKLKNLFKDWNFWKIEICLKMKNVFKNLVENEKFGPKSLTLSQKNCYQGGNLGVKFYFGFVCWIWLNIIQYANTTSIVVNLVIFTMWCRAQPEQCLTRIWDGAIMQLMYRHRADKRNCVIQYFNIFWKNNFFFKEGNFELEICHSHLFFNAVYGCLNFKL